MVSKNEIETGQSRSVQPTADAVDHKLVGTMLGKYKITEFVAQGGMGEVYKAIDEESGQIVACKLLLPALLDAESSLERFNREVKTLQRISSEHSVKVFDSGQANGRPYMILEFVQGKPLTKIIAESPNQHLFPRRAIPIFLQICSVLEEAHALRIIHRDLKPSNIMIMDKESYQDFVKVLDFGVAKVLDLTTNVRQATKTGEYIGSLPYSSPEQFTAQQIDSRSDIYALGCLMFEAIMGFAPFKSDNSAGYFYKHTMQRPPAIAVLLKHPLAPALELIIHKCLAKDPSDRYQSIAALKKDLENIHSKKISRQTVIFQFITKAFAITSFYLNKLKRRIINRKFFLAVLIVVLIAYVTTDRDFRNLHLVVDACGPVPNSREFQIIQYRPVITRSKLSAKLRAQEILEACGPAEVNDPDAFNNPLAISSNSQRGIIYEEAGMWSEAMHCFDCVRFFKHQMKQNYTLDNVEAHLREADCALNQGLSSQAFSFAKWGVAYLPHDLVYASPENLIAYGQFAKVCNILFWKGDANTTSLEAKEANQQVFARLEAGADRSCKTPLLLASQLSYAGRYYHGEKFLDRALLLLLKAEDILQTQETEKPVSSIRYNHGAVYEELGRISMEQNDWAKAKEFLSQAQAKLGDLLIKDPTLEAEINFELSEASWHCRDFYGYLNYRGLGRKLWTTAHQAIPTKTQ